MPMLALLVGCAHRPEAAADPLDVWGRIASCELPADLRCASECEGATCVWACSWSEPDGAVLPKWTSTCDGWWTLVHPGGSTMRMVAEGNAAGGTVRHLRTSIAEPGSESAQLLARLVSGLPLEPTAIERAGTGPRVPAVEATSTPTPGSGRPQP